jgi:hypothetical protein
VHYRSRKGRELLDYFAVGDSHLETNPMYGRGCASAFVQAQVFGEVFRTFDDPSHRAREYFERTHALLNPYFELSVATDRIYHTRAKLKRGLPVPFAERVINHAYEAAWLPATYASPLMAREFLKSVQMREPSNTVRVRILVAFYMLRAWLSSVFGRPSSSEAPPRAEFLRRLAARSSE